MSRGAETLENSIMTKVEKIKVGAVDKRLSAVTELAETMDTQPAVDERKIYVQPARSHIPTLADIDFDIDL